MTPNEKALVKALVAMIECYGERDDVLDEKGSYKPIPIIKDAVKAVRRVRPKYKFEEH